MEEVISILNIWFKQWIDLISVEPDVSYSEESVNHYKSLINASHLNLRSLNAAWKKELKDGGPDTYYSKGQQFLHKMFFISNPKLMVGRFDKVVTLGAEPPRGLMESIITESAKGSNFKKAITACIRSNPTSIGELKIDNIREGCREENNPPSSLPDLDFIELEDADCPMPELQEPPIRTVPLIQTPPVIQTIFSFINTAPPPGLLGSKFRPEFLNCIMETNANALEIKEILKMSHEEAWIYCDENFFIPHLDYMRSACPNKSYKELPYIKALEDILKGYLSKFSAERNQNNPDNQNSLLIQKLANIETQLVSMGKIRSTAQISQPVFQPSPSTSSLTAPRPQSGTFRFSTSSRGNN